MNDAHFPPAQSSEAATEPVFTTHFAHELQLVLGILDANAIPYSSVAHNPWSQKWSAALASQAVPSDIRWTVRVAPRELARARALVSTLPVSSNSGVANAMPEQEVRHGTAILVVVALAFLLVSLFMAFVTRSH